MPTKALSKQLTFSHVPVSSNSLKMVPVKGWSYSAVGKVTVSVERPVEPCVTDIEHVDLRPHSLRQSAKPMVL